MLTFAISAVALSAAMLGAWQVRMRGASSGWIDAIWSASVGIVGLIAILSATSGDVARRFVLASLLVLWSARLAGHIAARTVNSGDDPRYAALLKEWGEAFPRRLFLFLQIQALAGFILVLAIYLAASNPAPLPTVFDVTGGLVILATLVGEAVADAQLQRFKTTRSSGQTVCDTGLWSWSRHPNYFFEWLAWCGFALLAIDPSGGFPLGLIAFTAPIVMYRLLVHASGIPPLEAHMLASRGDAYRDYQARVSPFFPLPPSSNPRTTEKFHP